MIKQILKASALFLLAVFTTFSICVIATVLLWFLSNQTGHTNESLSAAALAKELSETADGYTLSQAGTDQLKQAQGWVMLLDEGGQVIWSQSKPEELPNAYTAADISAFSKWYLQDYPVTTWRYQSYLLVAGSPKNSLWKYTLEYQMDNIGLQLLFAPILFFILLAAILLLSHKLFRREQGKRDLARSRWIDGISHDIRTPISIIMGYAEQWQRDSALSDVRQSQGESIVAACQKVSRLVADLNLTMRLDYEMQPLRKEWISAAGALRTAGADALNSGLTDDLSITVSPEQEKLRICADSALLQRALSNLIQNAVRHGSGSTLTLRLAQKKNHCIFITENPVAMPINCKALNKDRLPNLSADGAAVHGTGLHLVWQVAKAHKGRLHFSQTQDGILRAELYIHL